jgi:thiol-disulfide isomerase/thioredoxin
MMVRINSQVPWFHFQFQFQLTLKTARTSITTNAKLGGMKYLLALLIGLYMVPSFVSATPGEVPVGGKLRDTPMQGLTGNSLLLSEYFGKPLIINVWASYCSPCLAEMGSLERLSQHYGNKINVIGISIDDYPDRANAFLDKAKTTFPHYIDHQLTLENMLGSNSIPLTLLIDDQGRVLHKVRGAQEWDSRENIDAIARTYDIEMSP